MNTCETCKHFEYGSSLIDGDCHRYPPTSGVFRPVKATDFCGEWKSGKKSVTPRKKFKKPTLAEVKEYIVSRRSTVNADKWMDHYESKGWQIGSGGMKDWKSAVRTWEDDKIVGSKSCVDCSAPWKEGFKFTGLGKARKYRCPECTDKRNTTQSLLIKE